ncbi:PREDICTED: gastrokine-2-like [Thamnophis sirtalis]|uniref:Gastrokine-2 n=1 Tax=Thamnophis sirtalis TaxID=35019 RepID=A0A6I9Z5I3_9SAUR|nr:PREDICTED: gastrokine-2-like [Thamnophis sirtalis]XP_013931115.1 PREDICTED: gastrokine-2-like [Thamnophis sirtalis]
MALFFLFFFQAASLILLGFFWNAASASFQIYSIPSMNGDYIQQTVTIDNEKKVAIIHVHEGSCSSDTIFDYKHGYIAMRIFSRRSCFVMKMEKGYIPEIEEIGRLAYEKQMMRQMLSGRNLWVKYEAGNSFLGEIKEWLVFGKHIEHLCKHIPVYKVERVEREYPRRKPRGLPF